VEYTVEEDEEMGVYDDLDGWVSVTKTNIFLNEG
jgi:hypothetical protein